MWDSACVSETARQHYRRVPEPGKHLWGYGLVLVIKPPKYLFGPWSFHLPHGGGGP